MRERPRSERTKARRLPSGDQSGRRSSSRERVTRVVSGVPARRIQMLVAPPLGLAVGDL